MLRMIGIVLVIWGLIAQPLMAAMPDSMHLGESSSSMSMDDGDLDIVMSHPGTMGADQPSQPSQPPCHETAAEDAATQSSTKSGTNSTTMPCTNCDSDCANGACASVCSPSTLAVLNQSLPKLERLSAVRVVGTSVALVQGLPVRIFHPPKHA